jgi:outer membrane receptor protein involved in Fe transport
LDKTLSAKTSLKLGLRYEYTDANLGSETQKNIVDRTYGNLFPTVYLNHKLTAERSLNFSYNRRINRPTFNQLAPFLIFIDPKTFISGNPAVQPSFTDAVKVDYVVKRLVFSASYSFENDPIARFVPETNTSDNTQTIMAQNMDYLQLATISATLPVRITSWWMSALNLSVNWNKIRGMVNKEMSEFEQVYLNIGGAQIFTLPRQFNFEISGFFVSRSFMFNLLGSTLIDPYGMLNVALNKKFGPNGNTLTVGVDNLLNSLYFRTSLTVPGQGIETSGYLKFAQPTFKISYTQSFGNKALKDKRNRATGADDVKKRVE